MVARRVTNPIRLNTLQNHHQTTSVEFVGLTRTESPFLETLMPDSESITIPAETLKHRPTAVAEDEVVAVNWLQVETLPDHTSKTVE